MEEVKTESGVDLDNSVEATTETSSVVNLKDLLSDDLKEHKALQNYEDVNAMAKSLLSAQSMVGKKITDLTSEELISIDKKFGKPENISEYNFPAEEEFKNKALELGLNHNQALKLFDMEKIATDAITKSKELDASTRVEEVGKELEGMFGAQLEARVELAKKTALELGGADLYDTVFNKDNLGDPKIIKALSDAGKRIFDHESVGTDQVTQFGLTASEANNEISLLKADPAFLKLYTSGNREAVNKLSKLYKIAAG